MKRTIVWMLALCLIISMVSMKAQAAEVVDSGTCGENLTWVLTDDGTLTISGEGKMNDYIVYFGEYPPWEDYSDSIVSVVVNPGVTAIGGFCFTNDTNLMSLTIPDTVTAIGDRAFDNTALVSVSIPDSVTFIDSQAFGNCSSLKEIRLSENLTEISDWMFENCTSLESINIPDSVTAIGKYAFNHCENLSDIYLPHQLVSIGHSAFGYCKALTQLTLPDNVETIGDSVFFYCSALEQIDLPDSLTTIGDGAFTLCTALTELRIPTGVESIICEDGAPFSSCSSLTGIWVNENNAYYSNDPFGVLFNKSQTELIQVPQMLTGDYQIPDGVQTVGLDAFDGCDNLTSVQIPESVTEIVPDANGIRFGSCPNISGFLVSEANAQFVNDESGALLSKDGSVLIKVPAVLSGSYTVPACVSKVGAAAFERCEGLQEIVFPEGVSTFDDYAFCNSSNLNELRFPETAKEFGAFVFQGCDSLHTAYFTGDAPIFNQLAISSTEYKLHATFYFPEGNETWSDLIQTYLDCITWVPYNPDEVPTEPEIIASGWSGYTTWTLDDAGLLTVSPSDQTLNGKCNMRNYWKVDGVLSLPWSDYADQITTVVIEEGIHAIGQMAFYELPNLQTVVLPESLEEIRNYAFKLGTALNEINLENVDYIREGAFYGCTSLAEVTLGEDTIVESWAFSKVPGYAG